MIDFEGRVIAIAGAGDGLGPTVARRVADAGATLALSDVATGRLDSLVEDLTLADDRCDARVADLLGDDGAREWANALEERFGGTDACFISSAAGAGSRSRRRRSPTTSGWTTSSCAPSSTPPAPSTRPSRI